MTNNNEKSLVPAIRFKGFTDAWEQRRLGDVSSIGTGDSDLKDAVPEGRYPFFVRSDVVYRSDRYLYDGEAILIPGEGRLGEIFHYYIGKFDYHQRVYKVSDFGIEGRFVLNVMQSQFKKHALANTVKATVDSIRRPTLAEFKFAVAPCREEQQMIAELFEYLDRVITLHQRKLDKLKLLKQSLLEKLFPQEGSDVPDVRFKGFTNAWEQRRLGELASIIGGGTPSTTVSEYWDGNINWFSPTEIGTQIKVFSSAKKITATGLESCSAKILPENKTILFTSRAGIGDAAILGCPGCTNQGFQNIVVQGDHDVYFLYSLMPIVQKWAITMASGSTFLEISGKKLSQMPIAIPDTNEQANVGNLFSILDNLITLHQRKLDKLKKMKQALLEKMFV